MDIKKECKSNYKSTSKGVKFQLSSIKFWTSSHRKFEFKKKKIDTYLSKKVIDELKQSRILEVNQENMATNRANYGGPNGSELLNL